MKKPVVFIIVGGILLGILGAGAYVYFSKTSDAPKEVVLPSISPTPAVPLVTWDDPAGFTMQYPQDVVVNKHDEDSVNYAHVELSSTAHPGRVIVWVKDMPKGVTNTVSWGKLAATPSSAISFDTTLGGQPAQKILVSGTPKMTSVGVVYDDVVWSVEATLTDEAYWQHVYDTITGSFVYKPVASTNQAPASGAGAAASSDDSSVDEEEIVE